MSYHHLAIDLSSLVPVRPSVPIVLESPQPPIVETPATFESIEGIEIITGILGAGVGLLAGWTICNWLTSQEFYTTWAKEILSSILPIRKLQLIAGVSGIIIEVVALWLGVEVPELE